MAATIFRDRRLARDLTGFGVVLEGARDPLFQMIGMGQEVRELAFPYVRRIGFDDVKGPGRERTDDLVEHVAERQLDHRLAELPETVREELDVLVLVPAMAAEIRGQLLGGRELVLEVVADPLRITLAAEIEVEDPAMRHRIRSYVPMELVLHTIDDRRHGQ
jgi:hypothetical protein